MKQSKQGDGRFIIVTSKESIKLIGFKGRGAHQETHLKSIRSQIQHLTQDTRISDWGVLIVLILSNTLLSYLSLPLASKFLIGLLGVLLPMVLFFRRDTASKTSEKPFYLREFLGTIPGWVWVLLGGAAVVLRFWRVTTLELWPTGDEALHAEAGLAIADRDDWRFFNTAGQGPPTLFWIYGLFFTLSHSVSFNLWVPPAIISILTVLLAYGTARQYFSKSLSFLVAGLWGLSYWPLLLGRVCEEGIVVPLFNLAGFYVLGKYLKAVNPEKAAWSLLLGTVTGLNCFTFTAWPMVVLWTGIVVVWETLTLRKGKALHLYLFIFGLGLIMGPWAMESYRMGFGRHILDVAAWSRPFNFLAQSSVVFSYVSVLFWGTTDGNHLLTPVEGGFLNPLLAAFFALGLIRFFGRTSMPFTRALALSFLLFLFPGFLTVNMEGMRIVQVLVPLLLVTAVGIQSFLERIGSRKGWILVGILLFTAFFDADRLWGPCLAAAQNPALLQTFGKSPARFQTYQILKTWKNQYGPGIILGEWDVPADRSLEVMTYYLNILKGDPSSALPSWLALVTDAHYLPFLKARFPDADWRVLDAEVYPENPRLLGILKINDSNWAQLGHWAKADPGFTLLNWDLDHIHDQGLMDRYTQDVQRGGDWVKDDPLIASMYWEKVAATYYYFGGHFPEHLAALENAVKYGYPASHLYGELASLYWLGGDKKDAEEAALKAKESESKYPWR